MIDLTEEQVDALDEQDLEFLNDVALESVQMSLGFLDELEDASASRTILDYIDKVQHDDNYSLIIATQSLHKNWWKDELEASSIDETFDGENLDENGQVRALYNLEMELIAVNETSDEKVSIAALLVILNATERFEENNAIMDVRIQWLPERNDL